MGSALRHFGFAPVLLAGLLPLDAGLESRWPWAGSWYMPAGDSFQIGVPLAGEPPYQVTRNVAGTPGGHSGADLSNRTGGGLVRAAANGIVVLAGTGVDPGGFGVHVVLAHRLVDGSLVYSVYAHLAHGSLEVRPGDVVEAGAPLGRVGMTGRATAPHLHFEVRVPALPDVRWEKAPPVDPVAFVAARVPFYERDSTWARPWLLWGESAALVDAGRRADEPLTRGEWWCALAAALAVPGERAHLDPERARAALAAAGVEPARGETADVMTLAMAALDVERVQGLGWRLPSAPAEQDSVRQTQVQRFDSGDPLHDARRGRIPDAPLTRAGACLLLAGLAPAPPAPSSEHRAVRD